MKTLFAKGRKSLTAGEIKAWLADINDDTPVSVEISPKWGSNISAKAIRVEKVGKRIFIFGFEKE